MRSPSTYEGFAAATSTWYSGLRNSAMRKLFPKTWKRPIALLDVTRTLSVLSPIGASDGISKLPANVPKGLSLTGSVLICCPRAFMITSSSGTSAGGTL